ncbi:MAG: hypothetical protein IID46_00045 [Planctomycetes bacterium]|nr:hypothetical protein [Planctomycetota bacterium]
MTLSNSGLRRMRSLILSPPPTAILRGKERPRIASRDEGLEASKRHYQAVEDILDDLQRSNRRAKNYARTTQWHEKFAQENKN